MTGAVRGFLFGLVMLVVAVQVQAASASTGWFDYKRISNTDSRLVWKYVVDGSSNVFQSPTWRAGSGSSTKCGEIGRGWLPLGWYDTWGQYDNYNGSAVKGRVVQLQDKACGDGTRRTELFIHTEETSSNGQSCPTSGDDPFCWEAAYDYYSAGCIKLARASAGFADDIGAAHWYWHNRYGSTKHGAYTLRARLYVHGH